MIRAGTGVKFPLGLLLVALALAAFKALVLSREMAGDLALAPGVFALDLGFLALLTLFGLGLYRIPWQWLRLPVRLVLILSVAFYLVHTFVLLALDESMSLFDVARYLPETAVVGSFFDLVTMVAITGFAIGLLIHIRLGPNTFRRALWLSLLMLVTGLVAETRTPAPLARYGMLHLGALAGGLGNRSAAIAYTREEASFFVSGGASPVEFIRPEPDVILLIVESLSSINSKRVSGVNELLGGFDRLSEDGVLFSNFFANHGASEGGIISLLSGFPPLHYPTATPLMFDEFGMQPSVIGEYRQQGYYTEFLTNADLAFIGLDRYIGGLGLDAALGRDEVPAMRDAPRFAQDAPSDRLLYREALKRVELHQQAGRPWLMAIATVSTHLPYRHPEGGEGDAESVWRWAQARLEEFVGGLREMGFFDNGILLVTGDHRQMRPLTRQETDRYGDSAKARVPLLAIGAGLGAGLLDQRFFQQSDLLRLLPRIRQPGKALSPNPIWVERYNRIYGKVDSINRFSVFDASNEGREEYPVRVSGARLDWPEGRPGFARDIESLVHSQRSSHQFNRNGEGEGCRAPEPGWSFAPSEQRGLRLTTYPGGDVNRPARGAQAVAEVSSLAQDDGPGEPDPALLYRAYLEVKRSGVYWFRTTPLHRACLAIDGQLVLDQAVAGNGTQGPIELEPGLHPMEFRVLPGGTGERPVLQWVTPGLKRWRWRDIPEGSYRLPLTREGAESD